VPGSAPEQSPAQCSIACPGAAWAVPPWGHRVRSPVVDRASGARDHASSTDVPLNDTRPLMARKHTGSVFEKVWADGTTISYGAYVSAYGQREKVTFGTNKQG
jgi:hypothetical protein